MKDATDASNGLLQTPEAEPLPPKRKRNARTARSLYDGEGVFFLFFFFFKYYTKSSVRPTSGLFSKRTTVPHDCISQLLRLLILI